MKKSLKFLATLLSVATLASSIATTNVSAFKESEVGGYVIPETKITKEILTKGKMSAFLGCTTPKYIYEQSKKICTYIPLNIEHGEMKITRKMLQDEYEKNKNVLNNIIDHILPEEISETLDKNQQRALCIMTLVYTARDSTTMDKPGRISRYLFILILLIANWNFKIGPEQSVDVDQLTVKYINTEIIVACSFRERTTFQTKLQSTNTYYTKFCPGFNFNLK